MSKVWVGDSWRQADDDPAPRITLKKKGPTRAEEQERIDVEFCNARMGLDEWRRRSDELSETTKWDSKGRIK